MWNFAIAMAIWSEMLGSLTSSRVSVRPLRNCSSRPPGKTPNKRGPAPTAESASNAAISSSRQKNSSVPSP